MSTCRPDRREGVEQPGLREGFDGVERRAVAVAGERRRGHQRRPAGADLDDPAGTQVADHRPQRLAVARADLGEVLVVAEQRLRAVRPVELCGEGPEHLVEQRGVLVDPVGDRRQGHRPVAERGAGPVGEERLVEVLRNDHEPEPLQHWVEELAGRGVPDVGATLRGRELPQSPCQLAHAVALTGSQPASVAS